MLPAAQLAILATELTTDPLSLGYSGTQDKDAALLLNDSPRLGQTCPVTLLQSWQVLDAVVPAEFVAVTV